MRESQESEQSVAHGAAEPRGLTLETRSPRPGERSRSLTHHCSVASLRDRCRFSLANIVGPQLP